MFFSEGAVRNKLMALTISKESIQELSLWLIRHRNHHSTVVNLWRNELLLVSEPQKLALIYLASDILQRSKRKEREYRNEFGSVLEEVFENVAMECHTTKVIGGCLRMLDVWERVRLFSPQRINAYRKILDKANVDDGQPSATSKEFTSAQKLVRALRKVDNAPSCDFALRQMLQLWPAAYYDIDKFPDFKHKDQVIKFSKEVGNALRTINGYNADLKDEMHDRDELLRLLTHCESLQKELLEEAERKMAQFTKELNKLCLAHEAIKEHRDKLPDMPSAVQPLPTPANLFMRNAQGAIEKRIASLPATTSEVQLPSSTGLNGSDSSIDDN